jgi:hypothetical protein
MRSLRAADPGRGGAAGRGCVLADPGKDGAVRRGMIRPGPAPLGGRTVSVGDLAGRPQSPAAGSQAGCCSALAQYFASHPRISSRCAITSSLGVIAPAHDLS